MVKIAVLGDTESIKGFAAVGLDVFPCDDTENAERLFSKITSLDYGVIYVTEHFYTALERQIKKTDRQLFPSVVPIPGVSGNNGCGIKSLSAAVEKAVGSDIIFGKKGE